MDDLDRKIEEALGAEDHAILEKFGEQGLLHQWLGVYRGAMGGLALLASVVTIWLFLAALYCGWRFAGAREALSAARWGTAAALLVVMTGYLKIWFWLRMESNRVLREVKRLELQIARAGDSGDR
ncbi:MAG: DUF6768 family protein [Thermoanaerobaculia bacterium]